MNFFPFLKNQPPSIDQVLTVFEGDKKILPNVLRNKRVKQRDKECCKKPDDMALTIQKGLQHPLIIDDFRDFSTPRILHHGLTFAKTD